MKISPWLVGALAVTPIVGAFAGQQISAEPLTAATDVTATLPERPHIAHDDATPRTQPRLPNHYAMKTPEGVVEVHELAMRGRFRDRYDALDRYQARTEENLTYLEARWEQTDLDHRAQRAVAPNPYRQQADTIGYADREIAHYAASERARTGEAATPQGSNDLAAAQPVQTDHIEIAVPQPRNGQPKVVDVRRELALRQ